MNGNDGTIHPSNYTEEELKKRKEVEELAFKKSLQEVSFDPRKVLFADNTPVCEAEPKDFSNRLRDLIEKLDMITGTLGDAQVCMDGDRTKSPGHNEPSFILEALYIMEDQIGNILDMSEDLRMKLR